MEIAAPDTEAASRLVELWLGLAESQRAYGSHLLVEPNREVIRETVLQHIVTGSVLVARDDEIVGFVTFSKQTDRYAKAMSRGLIENLYVQPGRRGEGIGSALLEAAQERLAEKGVAVVSLEVMATNEEARRFYRRHGYGEHRLELEKRIDQ